MTHSNETFELGKILANTAESLLRAQVLMNSPKVGGNAKHFIKTSICNRLQGIERDILLKMPESDRAIMRADILSDETALQLEAHRNLFLSLSQDQRDDVEVYMESLKQKAA